MAKTEEEKKLENRERAKKHYYNNLEKNRARCREYQRKKRQEIKEKLAELEKLKKRNITKEG